MTKPAVSPKVSRGIAARGPAIDLARTYRRSWLQPDLLAAVTVWALLVPQALAHAQLAQVDAVVGLYAAMGAAIGYILLGGVRCMNVKRVRTRRVLARRPDLHEGHAPRGSDQAGSGRRSRPLRHTRAGAQDEVVTT